MTRRSVNPALAAIIAEGFFSRLSFGLIAFALPLYAHRLGLSFTEIGVLVSVNLMVSAAAKLWIGRLTDRIGYKRSAIGAILARSLFTALLAFAGTAGQLYVLQTMRGLAKSLRDPAMDALIAEHGGRRTIASAFAWYQTAKSAAGSLGKALAGLLLALTASNFSWVFAVACLLSIAPLWVTARYIPRVALAPREETRIAPVNVPLRTQAAHQGGAGLTLWPAVGFGFLVSGTAQMLRSLLPLIAIEYAGLTEGQTGFLYLVSTAVVLVSGPLFGWLSDHGNRRLVLAIRSFANVTSSAIYLVSPNLTGFLLGKVIDDAGKSAFHPAWGALMVEVSSSNASGRGKTMGIMGAAEDAGSIAGPVLAGLLWSTWGVAALFGVRILLAVLTEIYAIIISRLPVRPMPQSDIPPI